MRVIIADDPSDVARISARRIAQAIEQPPPQRVSRPHAFVLGVATGSSPLGTYRELAALVAAGELDTTGVAAFALDEYVGLDPAHPESYHSVIRRTVTEPLRLDPQLVHVPDGAAPDLTAACLAYESEIAAAGGVDLQLLGIGANGHVGFNEPTSSFASRTRLKALAPQTRADNARFFDSPEQVPMQSITQGLGTILEARELLLVAQGEAKAEAVAGMVEGPVTSMCPASALQLHPAATVVADRAAASQLRLVDYYEYAQAIESELVGWP